MNLAESLAVVKQTIVHELVTFFEKKRLEAVNIDPHLEDLVTQVRELTLRGGKKTRPFLVWLGYRTVGDAHSYLNNPPFLLHAMVAIELFQSYALIHDDIMDQDSQRRGDKTVHEYFRLSHHNNVSGSGALHFGESMAILAGDVALDWAGESILKTQNPKAVTLFHRMSEQTIYGQTLDILREQRQVDIDTSHIIKYKTAYYSVSRPLQIGAQLANCSENHLKLLELYGLAVGQLFQLRDDFLDSKITQTDLDQKAKVFMKQADQAIRQMNVDKDIETLLYDFARFVVERTA